VTVDSLNIRQEANATSAVVSKLKKGEYVQVKSVKRSKKPYILNSVGFLVHELYQHDK